MQRKPPKNNQKEGANSTESFFNNLSEDVIVMHIFPKLLDDKDIGRLKRVNKKFAILSKEELNKRAREKSFSEHLRAALVEGNEDSLKSKKTSLFSKKIANQDSIKRIQNILMLGDSEMADKNAVVILLTHAIFSKFREKKNPPKFIKNFLSRFIAHGIAKVDIKPDDVEETMSRLLEVGINKEIEKVISKVEKPNVSASELKNIAEKNLSKLNAILECWLYLSDENEDLNKNIKTILTQLNSKNLINQDSDLTKNINALHEIVFPPNQVNYSVAHMSHF